MNKKHIVIVLYNFFFFCLVFFLFSGLMFWLSVALGGSVDGLTESVEGYINDFVPVSVPSLFFVSMSALAGVLVIYWIGLFACFDIAKVVFRKHEWLACEDNFIYAKKNRLKSLRESHKCSA